MADVVEDFFWRVSISEVSATLKLIQEQIRAMHADLLNLRDEVVNLKVCSCQCPHPSGEVVSAAQPVEEYIMQQKPSDGGPASVKGACGLYGAKWL